MEMERLDVSKIYEGVCFSQPVYFDDGKNMFLPAGKKAKRYHIAALENWNIPYLLTSGHEIDPKDYVSPTNGDGASLENTQFNIVDIEDIESIDDLEEM